MAKKLKDYPGSRKEGSKKVWTVNDHESKEVEAFDSLAELCTFVNASLRGGDEIGGEEIEVPIEEIPVKEEKEVVR